VGKNKNGGGMFYLIKIICLTEFIFNDYKTTQTQIFLSQKHWLFLAYLATCSCFDLKNIKTSKEDSGHHFLLMMSFRSKHVARYSKNVACVTNNSCCLMSYTN
jgi:hypothetical protein